MLAFDTLVDGELHKRVVVSLLHRDLLKLAGTDVIVFDFEAETVAPASTSTSSTPSFGCSMGARRYIIWETTSYDDKNHVCKRVYCGYGHYCQRHSLSPGPVLATQQQFLHLIEDLTWQGRSPTTTVIS